MEKAMRFDANRGKKTAMTPENRQVSRNFPHPAAGI
jgi:hypothetical protein